MSYLQIIFAVLIVFVLSACGGSTDDSAPQTVPEQVAQALADMNRTTSSKLDEVVAMHAVHQNLDAGQMIGMLSSAFLGTPYRGNMLIGSESVPEKLVIDFSGLDCFTYLDYVESARRANTLEDFAYRLVQTRYVNGEIKFTHRRHFFTDWAYRSPVTADDITSSLSPNAVTVRKDLNRKMDGSFYLPGVPVVQRDVTYIPSSFVNDYVLSQLRTGDFIGIYSKTAGLDVTHVGIYIDTAAGPMLRNASSTAANMKVVDSPFLKYVKNTPGIVVLRVRPS